MPRRLTLAVAPLLLALALAGCTESTRLPPPEPPAAGEPLFASDEEALAAATAAYEEYLEAVDSALADPGAFDNSLEQFASGQALEEATRSVGVLEDRGLRFEGSREVTDVQLQQAIQVDDTTLVVIYVCESVASVDVLDAQGQSVVEPTRPDLAAFEVSVEATISEVLVTERTLWSDQQFCA